MALLCQGSQAGGMTLAAVVLALAVTEDMTANDQSIVGNLLQVAGQAIVTRAAALLPAECASGTAAEQANGGTADAANGPARPIDNAPHGVL